MNLVPGEMSSEESEFDVEENRERLNSLLSAPPPIREPGLEPCSFRYPKCQELGTTDKNKENLHRAHSYSKLRSVASQSSLSRIENGIVSRKNSMDM